METANEVFLKKFLEGLKEVGNSPDSADRDEDIFFQILNAGTVGELYGMDISIEDVEHKTSASTGHIRFPGYHFQLFRLRDQ